MATPFLLKLSCPNQPGIVARVTAELFAKGGNILEAHQFDDTETGGFFTRIVFNLGDERNIGKFVDSFGPIARQYRMDWEIRPRNAAKLWLWARPSVRSMWRRNFLPPINKPRCKWCRTSRQRWTRTSTPWIG